MDNDKQPGDWSEVTDERANTPFIQHVAAMARSTSDAYSVHEAVLSQMTEDKRLFAERMVATYIPEAERILGRAVTVADRAALLKEAASQLDYFWSYIDLRLERP